MRTVVVESNIEGRLGEYLARREHPRVSTKVLYPSGLFCFLTTITAPLAIPSTHVCGGEGEKRISLTQGGRLREGSAPSDKRLNRLMDCGTYRIGGSINKAAELNKGRTPFRTPNKVKIGVGLT